MSKFNHYFNYNMANTPYPVPTPWQPAQLGGNANVPAGLIGPSIPANFIGPILPPKGATYMTNAASSPFLSKAPTTNSSTQPSQQAPSQPPQKPSGVSNNPSDADYDRLGVARGDIGGYNRVLGEQQRNQASQQDEQRKYEDRIRGEINSGFDAYILGLDQALGNIGTQKAGQEQIVQNQYNQGVADIGLQKESSMGDLATSRRKNEEQQVKSLADIADNIRNLFQTGNVMLGTRGAGDSSAANQYSYAVTKLGSKQRGNVLAQTRSIENDIADREAKLNNVVTQETSKLRTERDNNILQIAQYFQDKQTELQQMKAQGQLQRGQSLANLSTQLLQNAQNMLMQADADYKNKQNTLLSWAASNAQNINQLKSNLAQLGQYNVPGLNVGAMNGSPTFDAQGNMNTSFYGGGGSTRDDRLKNPFLAQ